MHPGHEQRAALLKSTRAVGRELGMNKAQRCRTHKAVEAVSRPRTTACSLTARRSADLDMTSSRYLPVLFCTTVVAGCAARILYAGRGDNPPPGMIFSMTRAGCDGGVRHTRSRSLTMADCGTSVGRKLRTLANARLTFLRRPLIPFGKTYGIVVLHRSQMIVAAAAKKGMSRSQRRSSITLASQNTGRWCTTLLALRPHRGSDRVTRSR